MAVPLATANQQEVEFSEFLEKMAKHSELLHAEFHLLEQLASLRPGNAETTNHMVFQQMRNAFHELGRAAVTNQNALNLLFEASRTKYLQGVAVAGIGTAAENGNPDAVQLLLHPEENGWLLSSSAGALVNVARNGNDEAIAFFAAISDNPAHQALWNFAAEALAPAVEQGNAPATEALIKMSTHDAEWLRKNVRQVLKTAADKGNTLAAEAITQ